MSRRAGKAILISLLLLLILYGVLYLRASRWARKAIEKRNESYGELRDRYYSIPEERRKAVDNLIKNKDNPDELKRISIEMIRISNREHDIPESYAEAHAAGGMCAGFAEAIAQHLGNEVPCYSGDAWTMYRRNPEYRRYQLYRESIDLYPWFKSGREGPVVPNRSDDMPPLRTGDVVTMPWPGIDRYVFHAGVVIVDTSSTPHRKYLLETRGQIRMNEIEGGNIHFKTAKETTVESPVVEVIGDWD